MKLRMSTLKAYRATRDAEREPAPEPSKVEEDAPSRKKPGSVASAIERAREASAARGLGGAHTKLRDTSGAVTDAVLKFGRHKGKMLSAIRKEDPMYLDWLIAREHHPETRPDGFPADLISVVRHVRSLP